MRGVQYEEVRNDNNDNNDVDFNPGGQIQLSRIDIKGPDDRGVTNTSKYQTCAKVCNFAAYVFSAAAIALEAVDFAEDDPQEKLLNWSAIGCNVLSAFTFVGGAFCNGKAYGSNPLREKSKCVKIGDYVSMAAIVPGVAGAIVDLASNSLKVSRISTLISITSNGVSFVARVVPNCCCQK